MRRLHVSGLLCVAVMLVCGERVNAAATSVCEFGKGTVPEVICNGPTVLKDTEVTGQTKILGPMTARNITATDVTVNGSVDVENSHVTGSVIIAGKFQARNVVFSQDLKITSDNIVFSHVKVSTSLTVISNEKTPYVQLECGSIVMGNVTFVGKPGIVRVSDDSGVIGKVHNGTLEFIHKQCS